jgi:hypothetical protein
MNSFAMPVGLGLQPVSTDTAPDSDRYGLRYRSLFLPGRGYVFPCDAQGNVEISTLSDRARHNYLYAQTVAGSELDLPLVERQG